MVIVTTLATVGFGAGLLKVLGAARAWWAAVRDEKRHDLADQSDRRRADRKEAIDHYEAIIHRMSQEYDDGRKLWGQERAQLIQERDRVATSFRELVVQATMMQDRLAVYQGIGPEGAERMDPILVIQADGTMRWANDPAGTFLSYPTLALLGKPMTTILPRDRHEFFRTELRRIVERLESLPDNMPIRQAIVGKVRRRDGSTIRVCVVINGFRAENACSRCGQVDKLPVFRVHLRQRWESSDIALSPPNIPLNSSDGSGLMAPAVEPGADDRDGAP